jgi:hypothetical protein
MHGLRSMTPSFFASRPGAPRILMIVAVRQAGEDMQRRFLGNSDLQVSELCLGTMTFGQQNSEAEAHAQLDRALAAGINFIDTAEMYPVPPRAATCGRTEEIVGRWLRGQARDRLIVASKAAGPSRGLNWIRGGQLGFDYGSLRARSKARCDGCRATVSTSINCTGRRATSRCSASGSSIRPGSMQRPRFWKRSRRWRG